MRASRAPDAYSASDEDAFRHDVEQAFGRSYTADEDVEFTPDQRVIMTDASNNQRYRVQLTTVGGVRQLRFTPV